jgi:hypothetical protein
MSNSNGFQFSRTWAMPNQWTFTIGPIKELIQRQVSGYWADPFAGKYSPAQVRNDLNPDANAESSMDALVFLKSLEGNKFDGVLFDPPYSITQAAECYKSFGKEKLAVNVANMAYWKGCKDEMARITKVGGKVICCGWSSNGLGKGRGFQMLEILLVPHGGSKNDTIVTVERKL